MVLRAVKLLHIKQLITIKPNDNLDELEPLHDTISNSL